MLTARDGTLWAATTAGSLVRLRGGRFQTEIPAPAGGDHEMVSLAEDTNGGIWASFQSGGNVLRWNGGKTNVSPLVTATIRFFSARQQTATSGSLLSPLRVLRRPEFPFPAAGRQCLRASRRREGRRRVDHRGTGNCFAFTRTGHPRSWPTSRGSETPLWWPLFTRIARAASGSACVVRASFAFATGNSSACRIRSRDQLHP